jgi:hypothetical protein
MAAAADHPPGRHCKRPPKLLCRPCSTESLCGRLSLYFQSNANILSIFHRNHIPLERLFSMFDQNTEQLQDLMRDILLNNQRYEHRILYAISRVGVFRIIENQICHTDWLFDVYKVED